MPRVATTGLHKGSTRGSARSNGSAFDLSSEAVSIGLARALTRGRRLWGALAFDLDVSEEDVEAEVVDTLERAGDQKRGAEGTAERGAGKQGGRRYGLRSGPEPPKRARCRMNCRSKAPDRNPTTRWKTYFSLPANAGKGMEPGGRSRGRPDA